MRIYVTAEDIRDGLPRNCHACPIYRALKRAGLKVTGVTRMIVDMYRGSTYRLPKSAIEFISRFDNGKPVKPFSFEFPIDE